MDTKEFDRLVRRGFSGGVTGRQAFELELEARADERARRTLEQAEADDRNIIRLTAALDEPEPWYRSTVLAMAASAVLAAGLTLLIGGGSDNREVGVASASVHYLESTRGVGDETVAEIAVGEGQDWVTLVLYPPFGEYLGFVVDVQKLDAAGLEGEPVASGSGSWSTVWSGTVDSGDGDAVAITLERSLLGDGMHRVNINGIKSGEAVPVPAASHRFRVTSPGGQRP